MPKKDHTDHRFAEINWHPKFRRVPRGIRKVKIDERFQSMFDDPNFKSKHVVDKRGRPLARTSAEDLRRYYDLSSGSEEDGEKSGKSSKLEESESDEEKSSNEEEEDEGDEDQEEEENSSEEEIRLDLARGEGNLTSSSDSSSEWEFEERDDELHEWEDVDASEAPTIDKTTRRLAICNMDWERITARDLFCLLNSFKPASGELRSVRVYLSDFGQERLNEEQRRGPKELQEIAADAESDEESSFLVKAKDDERKRMLLEKLRQYEFNRLKYFYAVAEFDSAETADSVYSNCDGTEYETSGTKLDLRFVPDDTQFDRQPEDEALSVGDLSTYRPSVFVNKALQQSRPTLSWEEERNPKRLELTRKAFENPAEWDRLQLDSVLASPSESGESDDEETDVSTTPKSKWTGTKDELLDAVESSARSRRTVDDAEDSDDNVEMEIKWDPTVEEKLELTETAIEGDRTKKQSQWEKYLQRRKEKKRQRKEEMRQRRLAIKRKRTGSSGSDEDLGFERETRKGGKIVAHLDEDEDAEEKRKAAELELLLNESDNETKRRHFNLKKLLKQEKGKAGRREESEEDFVFNAKDPRFGAVFTSHLYNVDPSDPAFKKTPGMQRLIEEKIVKRSVPSDQPILERGKDHIELESLARKVKAKSDTFKKRRALRAKK